MATDPNRHDRFVMRQRIRPVINQYEISVPGPDGEPGEPVCFVEQARFNFKEDIRFYADETKSVELMRLKARQRFDPRARYDVTDDRGAKIGEIQKVFGESLLRSTYRLYDAGGAEVATAPRAQRPRRAPAAPGRLHPVRRRLRRLAPDPLPLRLRPRRRGARNARAPHRPVQAPRRLRHRHEPRRAAHARPPARARQRRRDGRAAGALS